MSRNINLMPGAYRERLGTARIRHRFATYGLAVAVVIGVLTIHSRYGVNRMQALANNLTAKVSELEAVRAESLEVGRRANLLAENLADYYRLALPIEVTDVLGLISQKMPEGLVVTEMNLGVSQRNESMSAMEELRQRVNRSKNRKTDERRIVRYLAVDLTGLGEDGVQVADFIGKLESHPAFGRVQLDFDRTKTAGATILREFRVRFEVNLENRFVAGADPADKGASDE